MNIFKRRGTMFAVALGLLCSSAVAQIPPESLGQIQSLPARYPPHWIVAADASFFHMNNAKFIVLDADSDDPTARYKGAMNGSMIPLAYMAATRPEFYVVDTFLSRGTRGERTDVMTIYDKTTLAPVDEVILPSKRISGMPTRYYLQTVNNEELALIFNFTPAQSVSVVDLENREFLAEISTAGCSLIYPMTGRAFASLCADGTMLGVQIDGNGEAASTQRTARFFDPDDNPLTEKPAIIDGVAYFPTFLGDIVPVDLTGDMPEPGERWSLVEGTDGGWRPGGIVLAEPDSNGQLYVMMHPEGYDGSHKDPGVEVWVFDPETGERQRRIELALPALTMAVTHDDDPLLVTTNINLEIDVYSAVTGEHQRTIGDFGQETVFVYHSER